ncbi:MAG: hypothetical protein JWO78_2231 [Micavibrio sp.]|nr:hypothetical protein [Micavibrio sp.]
MSRQLMGRLRNRAALMDKTRSVAWDLDAPMASFTFDDFPADALEVGGRILKEEANACGTYYVSGCFMGKTIDGIKFYEEGHLKDAAAQGHEIGCHAFQHEKLGQQGPRFARQTCEDNAAFVRDILGSGVKMTSFAYPYGDTSLTVKSALSKKFEYCRGVRQELNTGKVDRGQISVISLEIRHAAYVDIKRTVADAVANKSWIVFLTHDIRENPSPYGSTPAMLENAVKAVTEAGIQILPLRDAAIRGFKKPQLAVSSPGLWVPGSATAYS